MPSEKIIDAFTNEYNKKYGEKPVIEKKISVSGGCINKGVGLLCAESGFFIKWNLKNAYPGMFETEAKGLKLLLKSNTLTIPRPLLCGEIDEWAFIAMEFIKSAPQKPDFWILFGQKLAAMHKHSSGFFGLEYDNYIGSLPQSNNKKHSWPEFFASERLDRLCEKAFNEGLLSSKHIRHFESFYKKLPDIFPDEPPALLHGDLWNGNYMIDKNGDACIMDPVVYYGHREMDLGMSKLFGGFAAEFYDAYHNSYPLEHGWQERLNYCNLYPLLVHLILFGSSYRSSIDNIINKF